MNLVGGNLATGDSLAAWYQLTYGQNVTDTSANWVAMGDTLSPSGPAQTVVDISQRTGSYLWMKFQNQTASQVVVPNTQRLYLRQKMDYRKTK